MKHVKKTIVVFGAVAIALLMVSTVTAVPQVNSKPVMEKVEQIEQLKGINKEGLIIDSEELIGRLYSIDTEEFWNLFTSMEFAEFMHEDEIQSLLSSDEYLNFFNSEAVQDFVNSDLFIEFLDSEPCQIFLDNYYGDDETSSLVIESQEVTLNFQQGESSVEISSSTSTNVVCNKPGESMAKTTSSASSGDVSVEVGEYELISTTVESNGNDPEPTFIIISLAILALLLAVVITSIFVFICLACAFTYILLYIAAIAVWIFVGIPFIIIITILETIFPPF